MSLSCEASGDPSPSVQWTRNGQPFPSLTVSSRVTVTNGNQTLTFSDTLKSDEGMYTCAATNSIRSDSDDVELVVYGEYRADVAQQIRIYIHFCLRNGHVLSLEPYML